MNINKNLNKSNVAVIIIVFLVILASLSIMFYFNLKNSTSIEVEGIVKLVGNNYIIVEDKNGQEYSLETGKQHNVGDRVDFIIKDIKKDSYPKEGDVLKIDTISQNINFYISDNNLKENDGNGEDTTNINVEETKVETSSVVSYFENLNNKLDTYNYDNNIGDSLKSGFVTIIDFLFYDGKINEKTFDELSNEAKIKVLQISFSIDEKIDKYFPGYKEQISKTGANVYTNLKIKVLEIYLDVTTNVCKNEPDTCSAAKEGLTSLKNKFSLTWDYIKEISGVGLSKLKEWYEVWKTV